MNYTVFSVGEKGQEKEQITLAWNAVITDKLAEGQQAKVTVDDLKIQLTAEINTQ